MSGFFMAALIAHHLDPKPLALLANTGIPTVRHRFFKSSHHIHGSPRDRSQVEHLLKAPVSVGNSPHRPGIFYLERLLASGAKNPDFEQPELGPGEAVQDLNRVMLYDYLVSNNAYLDMLGSVDPGFDWACDPGQADRLAKWPMTIFLQGDKDEDVNVQVCREVADALGPRSQFLLAEGEEHRFEWDKYIEEDDRCMGVVRSAVAEVDRAVAATLCVSGWGST
jgi:hypothetical protein